MFQLKNNILTRTTAIIAVVIVALTAPLISCNSVDDDRIPVYPVYLQFATQADWEVHGVSGACTYKRYIKSEKVPSNFPFTALTETGLGGILLVSDIHGTPYAYDLACPVECRKDVRIIVDEELQKARCPKCGSIFDIYTNYGYPVGGDASIHDYALQRYYVGPGAQGQYMIISR